MIKFERTRIAPTPSGFLHLGNIFSFALTVALARTHGAKIWLRIDDLDRQRMSKTYLEDIFETLHFLGIPWDEGPVDVNDFEKNHSQLSRMSHYREALSILAEKKLVYACVCSRTRLTGGQVCGCMQRQIPLEEENASWRFKTTASRPIIFRDYKRSNARMFLPSGMYNFVVRKKDGFPSYQLTSLIDDAYHGVDLVVRGADLLASTLAQLQLALALEKNEFVQAVFYHHPLITDVGGLKLSKSDGATSIKHLRERGANSAAIFRLAAESLGLNSNPNDWQQLADLLLL